MGDIRRNKAGAVMQFYARITLWANLPGKLMIFALFFDRYGVYWWMYPLAILFFAWLIFDFFYIFPQQSDFGFRNSQSMRQMQDDVKWIKQKLGDK